MPVTHLDISAGSAGLAAAIHDLETDNSRVTHVIKAGDGYVIIHEPKPRVGRPPKDAK